jgi:uncharacterized membrane protein
MDVRIAPNQGITGLVYNQRVSHKLNVYFQYSNKMLFRTNLACMVTCLWSYREVRTLLVNTKTKVPTQISISNTDNMEECMATH